MQYGIEAVNEGRNEQVLGRYLDHVRDKEGVRVQVGGGKDMDYAA